MTLVACLVVTAAIVAGCAKPPPPPAVPKIPEAPVTIVAPPADKPPTPPAPIKASMVIASSAETNPDRSGKPAPIVVRVYQLRRDAAFNRAEFLELFDNEKNALGPDLITTDEFVLAPSERKVFDVVLTPEARFVGALAAFREYRAAQWRAIVPVPTKALTLSLERSRLVMSGE